MEVQHRAILSLVIVLLGVSLGVSAGVLGYSESTSQADGTVIDFGDYNTVWADLTVSEYGTSMGLLEAACAANGFELVTGEDGAVSSIDGVGAGGSWALWAVYPGETAWNLLDAPYDQDPSEFSVMSWTFSDDGRSPTVAVDYSGHPAYGYAQKHRVVSLSPTVTETLCSLKASNIIVGADYYSDYPQMIVDGKRNGSITTVGTYTSPSFELITGTNPDLVVCDGSQVSHVQMADRLRSVGIDAIVTYPGEDVSQVTDNLYIVGLSLGYELAAREVIDNTEYVLSELGSRTSSDPAVRTMVTLEPDISPWVSGDGTFIGGILSEVNAENVFSEWYGWVHLTSERIVSDTDAIIIITTEYKATQSEYDSLYNGLSAEWKKTDAWKDGRVYVICEGAAEMAQRGGPRLAQTAELIAMMLHPGCFDTDLPKIVGDDYRQYLQYSKGMDYDE